MENPRPADSTDAVQRTPVAEEPSADEHGLTEVLIEDVSIDGMCGVY